MVALTSIFSGLNYPLLAEGDPIDHVVPHDLFDLGFKVAGKEVYFTNHWLLMCIVAVMMLIIFPLMARARNPVPTGFRNFFEAILSFLRTEVFKPALGPHTDRFVPFLWTVFFFVLLNNLLGMFPLGQIMTLFARGHEVPEIGGAAMANISVTGALAMVAFFAIHFSGIIQQVKIQMDPTLDPHHHGGKDHMPANLHSHGASFGLMGPQGETDVVMKTDEHSHGHHPETGKPLPVAIVAGIGQYIWNYAPHPKVGNKFGDLGLWVLLLVLEMIGTLVKPFSLAVRLFANMVAGHLLLAALVMIIPLTSWALMSGIGVAVVLGCTALSCLELFVAFLQAYIFTFLTTLFISSAVAPEH